MRAFRARLSQNDCRVDVDRDSSALCLAEVQDRGPRDQLMLEILLDIRDLFAVTPAAPADSGKSALQQLNALRRLTGR